MINFSGLGIKASLREHIFLYGEASSPFLLKLNTTISYYHLKQEGCTERGCSLISSQ